MSFGSIALSAANSLLTAATAVPSAIDYKSNSILSPFLSVDGDNKYRPFYTAPVQHDENTATIILVKNDGSQSPSSNNPTTDYLSDFTTSIQCVDADMIQSTNNEIPLLTNVGRNYYGVFKNFSVLGVNEVRSEITKVALNFGGRWNAYFFGSKPRVYSYTGIFLDAKNYPFYEQFITSYDNYLSGGKCIDNGFKMYLSVDGKITSGYMLGVDTNSQCDDPFHKTFSFTILIDDENFYRSNYVFNPDGSFLEESPRMLDNRYLIPGADNTY